MAPSPLAGEEEEEDEEEEEEKVERQYEGDNAPSPEYSSSSSASSTSTLKPLPGKNLFSRPQPRSSSRKSSLDPIPWSTYFAQELYLEHKSDQHVITYHVYVTPPTESGPLFVTHHGAGCSGLSFAVFASEVRKVLPQAGFLSIDARGHGGTVIGEKHAELEPDMSLDTLSRDMITMIQLTESKLKWTELPPLVLVGHSLGGAVVTHVASGGFFGDRILGYAVLDVVEGSAMDALQSMKAYLSSRPSGFPSVEAAIEWHTRSRTIRGSTSARSSVPSLLVFNPSPTSPSDVWLWRTNLSATPSYWEGWFTGLSKKFLSAKGGKLLLLAGTDRLDKELMIGQMQGKYQLQVFPEAGHFIHEDLPQKTASVIVEFYKRNDRSALVLPPKVGSLPKP
ncbi:MAG: Protein phosphatase methylesterase 1 [Piccolia ochrophora]|nr:MAG: Protein phosphatase methylesterase 1 [Piccolia ochrophora]